VRNPSAWLRCTVGCTVIRAAVWIIGQSPGRAFSGDLMAVSDLTSLGAVSHNHLAERPPSPSQSGFRPAGLSIHAIAGSDRRPRSPL